MASASIDNDQIEQDHRKEIPTWRRKQKIEDEAFSMAVFHRTGENSSSALNGDFLWFQLFIEVLLRMCDRELAKDDFISFVREQYADDQSECRKIDEFSTSYTADSAIKWYTRDCFIYRLINQALRLRDLNVLYMMRLIIIDVYLQLNKIKNTRNELLPTIHRYRGQAMSRKEVEQLESSVGDYVSMNSFFSTSADRQMSLVFSEAPAGLESVLFDIEVDTKLANVKPYACISRMSYYESEDETLFMLGTTFRLLNVEFNKDERFWLIKMELCSDDDSEIKPALENLKENIDGDTNAYELARIMCSLGDESSAERLVQRFIGRESPNQSTIGCCYTLLGIIEANRGNLDQAIIYHRQGLKLKQLYLPPNHPYIPYSHNNLGVALQAHGDLQEALEHYNRALDLWNHHYLNHIHENIAMCYLNIGMVYALQDNFELAFDNFTRAYNMMCTCLTEIHPRTASALKCIGSLYGNSGHTLSARKIFEKVLDIQRRCLPATHVDVANTLHELGASYFNSNELDQAVAYYQEALGIVRQTLPATHPTCLKIEQDLLDVEAAR